MNLTVQELAKLRTQSHRSVPYLSIYRPKTIFASRVTGSYNRGDTQISYYAIATGSYQNAYPNMEVLVGTTPGGSDKGRVRMRDITGSYSNFAENNIYWDNGNYLTFIDFIDVQAIFPRIIQDPSNPENVIFYKDNNIAYSNQNSVYGTFLNAGSHRAGFRETGTASFYFTNTGTVNVAGSAITHSWAFEGGTPTGSTAATPGLVSWQTPGHYKVRYVATAANGAVDTTYRYVSIYDRPESGVNVPILKWELSSLEGSRSEGGYSTRLRVWQDLGAIEPNALVVIFTEDWYGGEKISLGGNGQNNASIFFTGYILKDSIQFNYKEGWAEFDVGSVTEVMKIAEGFSISCESKSNPATWFQLQEMTVQKALYHYLRWHSTVLNVADFQYTGDDRLFQYFDTDRQSLFDAINSFISESLIGEVVSDRQGKIWAEITPVGYENPMTSIPQGLIIQKQDWMGEPNITERRTNEASFIEMGGIVYNGAALNTFQALLSNAPSFTPFYRGNSQKEYEGLILLSQSQLNQLSGNYLAKRNSKYEDVSFPLKGNYRNLDIAPQEKLFLLISEDDTVTRQSTIGYPFRMMSMNWLYNTEKEFMYPDASFDQIATGTAGRTLIIPPEPPTDGFNYPALNLPPLPDFHITSIPTPEQLSTTVVMLDDTDGLIYTRDFDAVAPQWLKWNFGISSVDIPYLHWFFVTPNGAVWAFIRDSAFQRWFSAIYYSPSVGGMFTKIIDQTWLDASVGAAASGIIGMGFNPTEPEQVALILAGAVGTTTVPKHFWIGDHTTFVKKVNVTGITNFPGALTYGEIEGVGKWVWDFNTAADEGLYRFNADGSSLEYVTPLFGQGHTSFHIRAGESGTIFKTKPPLTGQGWLIRSDDNVQNNTMINIDVGIGSQIATAPDGVFLMGGWDSTFALKGRSSDGGFSWSGLPNLPPGGAYAFAYAGGKEGGSKWIAARAVIRFSPDFGGTWINKEGNINQIFPIGLIVVRVVALVYNQDGQLVQS